MKGGLNGMLSIILILVALAVVAYYYSTKPGQIAAPITEFLDCLPGKVSAQCLCGDDSVSTGYCCSKKPSAKPCDCSTTTQCSNYKVQDECTTDACGIGKTCRWTGSTCAE